MKAVSRSTSLCAELDVCGGSLRNDSDPLLSSSSINSSNPMEASMVFWSVLGALLLLVLAAATYHYKRSSRHVRNSQHGQPMKNVEGATHAETVARNPNIMGGGDYFR